LKNKVIIIDKGYARIQTNMRRMERGMEVAIGLMPQNEERHSGRKTNTAVGHYHEFGTSHVPKRSFLRTPLEKNAREYTNYIKSKGFNILWGSNKRRDVLMYVATKYRADVLNHIASNIPPKLADSTIAKKGHDLALVDTGQMRDAIDIELRP